MCSIFAILVVWIFNFFTEFNDYERFTDGITSLALAPLTLLAHIGKHILSIFTCLFEKDDAEESYNRNYNNQPKPVKKSKPKAEDKNSDKREITYFVNMVKKRAKECGRIARYDYSCTYVDWATLDPKVTVSQFWGKIVFTGTIVFKDTTGIGDIHHRSRRSIEACVEETEELCIQDMKEKLAAIRKEYQGYDREYEIVANFSYRLENIVLD